VRAAPAVPRSVRVAGLVAVPLRAAEAARGMRGVRGNRPIVIPGGPISPAEAGRMDGCDGGILGDGGGSC
jgi:hypothetical protein